MSEPDEFPLLLFRVRMRLSKADGEDTCPIEPRDNFSLVLVVHGSLPRRSRRMGELELCPPKIWEEPGSDVSAGLPAEIVPSNTKSLT